MARMFQHHLSDVGAVFDKDMTACIIRRKDINMDTSLESFEHSKIKEKFGKQHIEGLNQYYLKSNSKIRMNAKLFDKRLKAFKMFIGITGHSITVHILEEDGKHVVAFEETYINRAENDENLFLIIAGLQCDKSLEEMMSEEI